MLPPTATMSGLIPKSTVGPAAEKLSRCDGSEYIAAMAKSSVIVDDLASRLFRAKPSALEIISAGRIAVLVIMLIGAPSTLLYTRPPIAPAACAAFSLTSKVQFPREISAMAPANEFAGSEPHRNASP